MSRRTRDPMFGATPGQWTHGEPVDDLKLHRRIDLPLEELGGIVRTWDSDLDYFYGVLNNGDAIPAGAAAGTGPFIPFRPIQDTAGPSINNATPGWLAGGNNLYFTPSDGMYLISFMVCDGTARANQFYVLDHYASSAAPGHGIYSTGFQPNIAQGGDGFGVVEWLPKLTQIGVTASIATNVAGIGNNWLFIQQLTWG